MPRALHCSTIMLALLAPGCCLPAISGRYNPAAASAVPAKNAALAETAAKPAADCELCQHEGGAARESFREKHGRLGHRLTERGWHLGLSDGPGTPPGEVIPLPKFHPVPTRPVFEPQLEYGLPRSLELPLAPLQAAPGAELAPTPAQPVPDPA